MKRVVALIGVCCLFCALVFAGCSKPNRPVDGTVTTTGATGDGAETTVEDGAPTGSGDVTGTGDTMDPTATVPVEMEIVTVTNKSGQVVTNKSGQPETSVITKTNATGGATTKNGGTAANDTTKGGATTATTKGGGTTTGGGSQPVAPLYGGIRPTSAEAGTPFYTLATAPADNKPASVTASTKQIGRFFLLVGDNSKMPFSVACHITDSKISAVVPAGIDLSAMKVYFSFYGKSLMYKGAAAVSQMTAFDLRTPQTLTLTANDGSTKNVTVVVEALGTGMPSIALTTNNFAGITSKNSYINMNMYVGGGDKGVCSYAMTGSSKGVGTVKGRGSESWANFPKKSYTVKMDEKASFFGLAESRDWTLLAHYEDKSLQRAMIGSWMAEQMGLPFTMKSRPVDFWLNGVYMGTYTLTEKVELEMARVNITQLDKNATPDKIGFLMEFDRYMGEVPADQKAKWQKRGAGWYDPVSDEVLVQISGIGSGWLVVRSPSSKNLTATHVNYVDALLKAAMDALKAGDWAKINQFIDVESFVKFYVVNEMMGNLEMDMLSGTYMYADAGGKLTLGPVWGFDGSAGNYTTSESVTTHMLYDSTNGWFNYLFKKAEARTILKTQWNKLKTSLAGVNVQIDANAKLMEKSQELNFIKWNILGTKVGSNTAAVVNANTFAKQTALLKDWLARRQTGLNSFISGLS